MFRVYVIHSNCARLDNFCLYDGLWWKWLFTLKNVSKNDWKLIIGEVGIKMSWVEKNRKINNRGGRAGGGGRLFGNREYKVLLSFCLFFTNFNLVLLIKWLLIKKTYEWNAVASCRCDLKNQTFESTLYRKLNNALKNNILSRVWPSMCYIQFRRNRKLFVIQIND